VSRTRTANRSKRRIRLNRRLPSSRTVGSPSESSRRSTAVTAAPRFVTPDRGAASNLPPALLRAIVPTRPGALSAGRITRPEESEPTGLSPSSSQNRPTSASQPSGPMSRAILRARQARTSRSWGDATGRSAAEGEMAGEFRRVVILPAAAGFLLDEFLVQPHQQRGELATGGLPPQELGQFGQVHQPVRVPGGP